MRESKYVRMPFYFLLSVIFSLAVWSLLFPRFFGDTDNASAATVDFASATTVSSSLAQQGKTRLLSVGGTYYLAFSATSTISSTQKAVYITTSTNGVSWSDARLALDLLGVYAGPLAEATEFGFVYNTVLGQFAVSGVSNTNFDESDVMFVTSTNAFTWSATTTVVNDTGSGFNNPNSKIPLSFSSTTGMYAMGFFTGPNFFVATSSNGFTWNSTSVAVGDSGSNINNGWLADVQEVQVLGNEIHVVYDNMVSGTSRFYEVLYASSTNSGGTWNTTTVTGHLNTSGTSPYSMRDATRAAINYDGKASVMYYDLRQYDSNAGAITGTIGYAHRSNTTTVWTTSTYDSNHMINSMQGNTRFHATDIIYYANDRAALAYYSDASSQDGQALIEFADQVTSTTFVDTGDAVTVQGQPFEPQTRISLAYTTSTQVMALAYLDGTTLKFTTSSVRSADFNGVPTSTPNIYPAASTTDSDAGLVVVTTTISDSDSDFVNLTVEYSVDGGSTWSAATITTATLAYLSPSIPTTGRITGILTSVPNNVLTFRWNSGADRANFATTTTQIRIRPEDAYGNGLYLASSNFEIDNLPPSSTTFVAATFAAGSSPSTTISWVGSAGAATYYVSSTASSTYLSAVSSTALTGLTPNTQYSYQIQARDSFGNLGPYSAVSSSYSNAATPTAPSAAAVDSQTITVSWNAASNGTGTQYEVSNASTGAVVGTTPGTSYSVAGLSKNTSYTFRVRAQFLRNGDVYTSYATASAVSTLGTGGGGGGGGGGSSPAPNSTPSAVTKSFTLNTPTSLSVGGASHSVNVSKATDSGATVTIKSDPITVSINKGETKNLDTDKDGVNDLRVSYGGLTESGQATLTFIPLIDLTELKEAMTINKGAYETSNKAVTISFNKSNFTISKATKMAVSETNDFTKLPFETFEETKEWTLTDGLGKKTIYVRIRTSEGTSAVISDSINLIKATTDTVPDDTDTPDTTDDTDTPDDSVPPVDSTPDETEVPLSTCALDIYGAYKAEGAPAVYYITNKCQKRAFTSAAKYLTYFSSWKDVQTVPASKLNSIANDSLGFMPWGPLWKPQWGAIVKHPADPKVYLLLNNEKYWITSETVFEALYAKGGWGWIEDVDPKLLDNYETGSEINYTDHHPNFTVIKYSGDPKVYRLEPDATGKQVKRHIKNEKAFEKLGFRWDRIVMLKDSETYTDGAALE